MDASFFLMKSGTWLEVASVDRVYNIVAKYKNRWRVCTQPSPPPEFGHIFPRFATYFDFHLISKKTNAVKKKLNLFDNQ
jgi:hypothetical protein